MAGAAASTTAPRGKGPGSRAGGGHGPAAPHPGPVSSWCSGLLTRGEAAFWSTSVGTWACGATVSTHPGVKPGVSSHAQPPRPPRRAVPVLRGSLRPGAAAAARPDARPGWQRGPRLRLDREACGGVFGSHGTSLSRGQNPRSRRVSQRWFSHLSELHCEVWA